jgi:integral membrane protein
MIIRQLLNRFESNQVFNLDESWMLFRLAAIIEACGWTLLISGIAVQRFVLAVNNIPVLIAGRIHGIMFLTYALASIGLYPTLRWSRKQAFIALLASVPPYGSIIFEEIARHFYYRKQINTLFSCLVLAALETN